MLETPKIFLIVDDEWAIGASLRSVLVKGGYEVLDVCTTITAARTQLAQQRPDGVFCDIYFGRRAAGIDFCRYLETEAIPYFFVTGAAPERVLPALRDMHPLGMILKPLRADDVLTRIALHLTGATAGPSLTIQHKGRRQRVLIADVDYLSSEGAYLHLFTEQQRYTLLGTVNDYAERLAPHGFARIHRSYVVNLRRVASHTRTSVVLSSGVRLPLGRRFLAGFRALV